MWSQPRTTDLVTPYQPRLVPLIFLISLISLITLISRPKPAAQTPRKLLAITVQLRELGAHPRARLGVQAPLVLQIRDS